MTRTHFPFSRFQSTQFLTFLKQCTNHLSSSDAQQQVWATIGNSACDLDSAVCSLVYAYHLHNKHPNSLLLPLHRISSNEWHLRTEIKFLLQDKLEISLAKDLCSWDTVQEANFLQRHRGNMKWILLDHHELGTSLEGSGPIVEVLDHHQITSKEAMEQKHQQEQSWHVEMVGSCCTLVAERILADCGDNDGIKEASLEDLGLDPAVMLLLLSTILIDTINLDPKFKKVTQKDIQMADRLTSLLELSQEERELLFDEIQKAKYDVSSLSFEDLLRSDYKEWQIIEGLKVGIASIRVPFSEALKKDNSPQDTCTAFMKEFDLDLLLIMCAFENEKGEFQRELGVFGSDDTVRNKVTAHLEDFHSSLHLRKQDSPQSAFQYYNQENVAASRKKLVPILFELSSEQA